MGSLVASWTSAQALQCLESCCLTSTGHFREVKPTARKTILYKRVHSFIHTGSSHLALVASMFTCWSSQDIWYRSRTVQKRFREWKTSIDFSGIGILINLKVQVPTVPLEIRYNNSSETTREKLMYYSPESKTVKTIISLFRRFNWPPETFHIWLHSLMFDLYHFTILQKKIISRFKDLGREQEWTQQYQKPTSKKTRKKQKQKKHPKTTRAKYHKNTKWKRGGRENSWFLGFLG